MTLRRHPDGFDGRSQDLQLQTTRRERHVPIFDTRARGSAISTDTRGMNLRGILDGNQISGLLGEITDRGMSVVLSYPITI